MWLTGMRPFVQKVFNVPMLPLCPIFLTTSFHHFPLCPLPARNHDYFMFLIMTVSRTFIPGRRLDNFRHSLYFRKDFAALLCWPFSFPSSCIAMNLSSKQIRARKGGLDAGKETHDDAIPSANNSYHPD